MTVTAAFDRAALRYDDHAPVQRRVAERLAERIATFPSPSRVLELGCGTGFLGEALLRRIAPGEYWMTDLAPAMVTQARARLGDRPGVRFAMADASAPAVPGAFDLICASLAFQWLTDLPAAVAALRERLAPGGRLAFTTLAAGSFAEWVNAHGDIPAGTPLYPTAERLEGMGLAIALNTYIHPHADARDFVRAVKAIGAGTPRPGHRPLPPAAMRAVMARFEASGAVARYVVATCIAENKA